MLGVSVDDVATMSLTSDLDVPSSIADVDVAVLVDPLASGQVLGLP